MTATSDALDGLVICKVGDHQFAFAAAAIEEISDWAVGDAPALQARAAFSLPAAAGRCLAHDEGKLVVDSLEIRAEQLALLPVPAMLLGAVGGALRGFVLFSGAPCPVLALDDFARFLSRGGL